MVAEVYSLLNDNWGQLLCVHYNDSKFGEVGNGSKWDGVCINWAKDNKPAWRDYVPSQSELRALTHTLAVSKMLMLHGSQTSFSSGEEKKSISNTTKCRRQVSHQVWLHQPDTNKRKWFSLFGIVVLSNLHPTTSKLSTWTPEQCMCRRECVGRFT